MTVDPTPRSPALKPGLLVVDDPAFNAETPLSRLDAEITPVEAFFVRNNGTVPEVGAAGAWTLSVDGLVDRQAAFTIDELRRRFESVTVTAVLECAGNNRSAFVPPTDGLAWGRGAVGCARWTGVRLADVLDFCGVRPEAVYTAHHSPDRRIGADAPAISRGLPIARALAPETLLAFAMNDAPLDILHGAPLRVVAPGAPGSAWQKWLSRIELRDVVHDGEKMNGTDYRLPREPVRPGEPFDAATFEIIEAMPVNAMITRPAPDFTIAPGEAVTVSGFAWSGEAPVAAVEVSIDDGASWSVAELAPPADRCAWRRFTARLVHSGGRPPVVVARARDANGRVQPVGEAPWNPRGYCNNAAHRVRGGFAQPD